jgi:hypothetical protein
MALGRVSPVRRDRVNATQTLEEVARELAALHAVDSHDDLRIYWFDDPDQLAIRLVEVSDFFLPLDDAEVTVYRFPPVPDEGFTHATEVVLATEQEWDAILEGNCRLPSGWPQPADSVQVWPA